MKKILIAFMLLTFAANARAEDLVNFYEVKDVPISQQGDNSANMRDKAITAGQRAAMDIFQQRLKYKNYITDEKDISDDQINSAIDSIEVRDEKIYTKSYRAKLNVVFTPRVISKLFNIDYVKPVPAPEKFLVIPILNEADGTKIWRHKWWDVMQKVKNKNIILPLGDLEDVRNLTKEDYSVRDFRNLEKLQKKYGGTAILLAVAEYIPTEKSINLSIEKIKGTDVQTYDYEFPGSGSDSEPQLFALAANELVKRVNRNNFDASEPVADEVTVPQESVNKPEPEANDIYQKSTPRTEKTSGAPLTVPDKTQLEEKPAPALATENQLTDVFVIAADLVSWGRIRGKITSTDLINNIRIKSFTGGRAFVTLEHNGEFSDVIAKLEASGLEVKMNGKYWEIREKRAGQ